MSLIDVEALLSRPVESKSIPRWERKQLAVTPNRSSNNNNNKKTPSSGGRCKTPTSDSKAEVFATDRFIPVRDNNAALLNNENVPAAGSGSVGSHALFAHDDINSKVLAFKTKAPKPSEAFQSKLRAVYSQNQSLIAPRRAAARYISSTPEKTLDAPGLVDDFYLNLLDWSVSNQLAVALGNSVYTWDATSGNIAQLLDGGAEFDNVTSVSWMADGTHVAIGTSSNDVQMWNVEMKKRVRSMKGHIARVGALSWREHLLSSASKDATIFHHDVRIAAHHIATLRGHEQEICGLKWSPDGSQLASGGNDNVCNIWDAAASTPKYSFTDSCAAVKALAWCPWQRNTLATGGGTADRHIRFYDTARGSLLNSIDTKSQVCSLVFSPGHDGSERELVSSHGFSQNQLTVWKFPSMVKVHEMTGHSQRVLHTALSPDGTTICSAAADESIRFWKVWEPLAAKKKSNKDEARAMAMLIR